MSWFPAGKPAMSLKQEGGKGPEDETTPSGPWGE
jgi:hypothetical protein